MKITSAFLCFFFAVGANAIGQTSFWTGSTAPLSPDITSDTSSVTLGFRFYSDVSGSVTGVRFFKGTGNTGQHVGTLWSAAGTKLAQVTFSGESASGWQQANFPAPVSITPNTVYVISYLAPNGNYADDPAYPWSNLNVAPLHPSGSSPGVFAYGSSTTFPTGTYDASNYYVDLVFAASTQQSSGSGSSSFWNASSTPATPDVTDDAAAVTLGLQFYSDVPGAITGLRFYKGVNNSGTHVGTLWTSSGGKLAQVTFSGETASGWQQASFSPAVSILANTTYVISYLAPNGNYADDQSYPWSTLNAAPLHVSGSSPGVYTYGAAATFPQTPYNGSNYWVDPIFASGSGSGTTTYTISGTVTGSAATLTVSGASSMSATTNSAGSYSFPGLGNGSYVVAASQSGYAFTPTTASVTINGASVTGINFSAAPAPHSVSLSWDASTSANVDGYNVYRSTTSGGPYTKLTPSPITVTAYVDSAVTSGQTYYYASTAMDTSNVESGYSNIATAVIP
jgi:hypothetical protein